MDALATHLCVCKKQNLKRIRFWDHVRRKFVEATKAAEVKVKSKASKSDVAVSKIRKLYLIEIRFNSLRR